LWSDRVGGSAGEQKKWQFDEVEGFYRLVFSICCRKTSYRLEDAFSEHEKVDYGSSG